MLILKCASALLVVIMLSSNPISAEALSLSEKYIKKYFEKPTLKEAKPEEKTKNYQIIKGPDKKEKAVSAASVGALKVNSTSPLVMPSNFTAKINTSNN